MGLRAIYCVARGQNERMKRSQPTQPHPTYFPNLFSLVIMRLPNLPTYLAFLTSAKNQQPPQPPLEIFTFRLGRLGGWVKY